MIPDRLWALLEPALAEGWTRDRVETEIAAQRAWLWPAMRAAVVTQITDNRDFHIWLGGGDLAELLSMHDSAEAHARAQGCERMTIIGRKGWAKMMAPLGYETLLAKDLTA